MLLDHIKFVVKSQSNDPSISPRSISPAFPPRKKTDPNTQKWVHSATAGTRRMHELASLGLICQRFV